MTNDAAKGQFQINYYKGKYLSFIEVSNKEVIIEIKPNSSLAEGVTRIKIIPVVPASAVEDKEAMR